MPRGFRSTPRSFRPRGAIFVTAMWVSIVLGALVLVFARSMRVELIASANRLSHDQAAGVELGAEQWVLAQVDNTDGEATYLLNFNAEGRAVGNGYFWLIRPAADEHNYDFGLIDEAGKVNINTAQPLQLVQLPGITTEAVDSIVDWRDPDENVTNGDGAESQYYLSLPEPYKSKNQPFETVEELKLVKGLTPQVLYGIDTNHNGVIEPGEQSRGVALGPTLNGSSPDRGIFPFVTVYTVDPNTDVNGRQRVSVNAASETLVVVPPGGVPPKGGPAPQPPPGQTPGSGGRGSGRGGGGGGGGGAPAPTTPGRGGSGGNAPAAPTPAGAGGAGSAGGSQLVKTLTQAGIPAGRAQQIVQTAAEKGQFANVFDFAQKVGMTTEELKLVADRLTTNARPVRGLINVNTAPREVLLTLPGLTSSDVDALMGQRESANTISIAWVADAITLPKAAQIGSLITNRSFFYSADILAVSGDGRAFSRVRIVVDARNSPAKIIYRKDLSALGWPLPQSVRDSLRAGHGPGPSLVGSAGINQRQGT